MAQLRNYLRLARVRQYSKNLFLFLPIFFGHQLLEPHLLVKVWWAFASFSLAASSVYVFNDLVDLEADRNHPVKKERPLPSGVLGRREAAVFMGILALLALAFWVNLIFLASAIVFLIIGAVGLVKDARLSSRVGPRGSGVGSRSKKISPCPH